MNTFSDFTDEEIDILIALPYKAGIWVSHADDEDGEFDDERELAALEAALNHIAQAETYEGFVKSVFEQTIAERSRWDEWAHACFSTPKEAERVGVIIKERLGVGGVRQYTGAVMDVASAVAKAYGEFGDDDMAEPEGGISALIGTIMGKFKGLSEGEAGHPMNISAAEDSALSQLKVALLKHI